jgi:hypothetical protein
MTTIRKESSQTVEALLLAETRFLYEILVAAKEGYQTVHPYIHSQLRNSIEARSRSFAVLSRSSSDFCIQCQIASRLI